MLRGGVEFIFTLPLISALDVSGWSPPHPGRFTLQERPGMRCNEDWVGPTTDENGCGKSRPHRDSLLGQSATCPYAEPARSIPCFQTPLPEDPSSYYLPIYAWVFQVVCFPYVSITSTLYTNLLSPQKCQNEDGNPVGARFSAHVQTGPGAHPVPCIMCTVYIDGA